MANQKHTHKLRRHTYKTGNAVYFCALPDCSYKIHTALALGKRSVCWRCGEDFIMNEYAIRLAKPHCEKCHKPKVGLPDGIVEQAREALAAGEAFIGAPISPKPMSLAERLSQVVAGAKPAEADEDI